MMLRWAANGVAAGGSGVLSQRHPHLARQSLDPPIVVLKITAPPLVVQQGWLPYVSRDDAGTIPPLSGGAISTFVFAIGMLNLYSFYVMPIQILIVAAATSMAALRGRLAESTTKFAIWGTWLG